MRPPAKLDSTFAMGPRAKIDLLEDPPPLCGDLSAHVELSAEAAERFADVLDADDGPTPAMLALFERYGRR